MPSQKSIASRFNCPCCGFPTIDEPSNYDICEICFWEDDGQGDPDAGDVNGGPNSDYSLTEARSNFRSFGTMYRPGHNPRIGGADNERETNLKSQLKSNFSSWRSSSGPERESLESRILGIEHSLFLELKERVRQYEQR